MPARLPTGRRSRKYGRVFEPEYSPNATSPGMNVFGSGSQYGGFAYRPAVRYAGGEYVPATGSTMPGANGGGYVPATGSTMSGANGGGYVPATGSTMSGASPTVWTPPGNLSESDWVRMTQGYKPYSKAHPEWGGYWTGSGINYGLSDLNFSRTFEDQDALAAQGLGNALNRYGQPIGTIAPLNYTQNWSSPQFATGRREITPELLQQSYKQVDNYIKNWRKSGKAGSYTAARNSRQLALLKRRKGIIKAIAKANNIDLEGGEGAGVSPAWVGNIASWNI